MAPTAQRLSLEQALASSAAQTRRRYASFVNPELARLLAMLGFERRFVEARGCTVIDEKGEKYLDLLGGYGALNLGHNHPELQAALERVQRLPNILQISLGAVPAALAETLAAITPGDLRLTFFGNSGAEAVEGALKLARISTGRQGFVSCDGSFHGKSFGALSVSGRKKYREPFEPLLPGCRRVPFGDEIALAEALRGKDCAAFIVEPIQGEGGIVLPPDGYLKAAQTLCRETGTLLIVDEVQTGFGRTGRLFACEYEGVEPDILVVAKSLGGGVMPIGAYIAREEVWQRGYGSRDGATLHTSTFGGNTRACAAGLVAVDIIVRERLSQEADRKGKRFLERLRAATAQAKLVKEVRGRGLMVGVEFTEPKVGKGLSREYLAALVAGLLFEDHHIITAYTLNNPNVIRFEPPLTITDEELDRVVAAMGSICRKHAGILGITARVSGKVLKRRLT